MDLEQLISFYKYQIERYKRIGIGNITQYNTVVCQKMIDTSNKRLDELVLRKEQGKPLS